ncbi:hypothetical protein Tco_0872704 [Tanacetum coccineum]
MQNNSQVKKKEVEDHRRNFKFSNNKTSITACNDSLNVKTSNVNFVCVICGKHVFNQNHDLCVLKYIDGVHSRSNKPMVVPNRTRKPKKILNQSVSTTHKRIIASESTTQKLRSTFRRLYENVSKTCSWWYTKLTPPGYKWVPKSNTGTMNMNVSLPIGTEYRSTNYSELTSVRGSNLSNTSLSSNFFQLVEIILFIVDSGCTKHMTGNLKLLTNFVEKVRFGNDIYGDLIQGNVTIKRFYYVEGLDHNLFSVGQFCDADLEGAFRKSSCHIRYLKGNELLTGSRGTDLYSITLQEKSLLI